MACSVARSTAFLILLVLLLSFSMLSHSHHSTLTPPTQAIPVSMTAAVTTWRVSPEGRELLSHRKLWSQEHTENPSGFCSLCPLPAWCGRETRLQECTAEQIYSSLLIWSKSQKDNACELESGAELAERREIKKEISYNGVWHLGSPPPSCTCIK